MVSLQIVGQADEAVPSLPLPYPLALGRAGLSGFPSPAQDYEGRTLDLNERFVKKPSATFFLAVTGDSMGPLGIHEGDTFVVDRCRCAARSDHRRDGGNRA